MKLSKKTVEVLKNFSLINQGLLFKPGSVLRTMNVKNNVFATANIDDEFPRDFAIYDLNEFLGTYSLFTDPELDFTEEYVKIQSGNQVAKYYYSSPSVIISPPDKEIRMPSEDVKFTLPENDLGQLSKAAATMKLKNIAISPNKVTVMNRSSTGANVGNRLEVKLDMEVGGDEDFMDYLSVDLLRVIPMTYDVTLVHGKLARFQSDYLTYYIALETE